MTGIKKPKRVGKPSTKGVSHRLLELNSNSTVQIAPENCTQLHTERSLTSRPSHVVTTQMDPKFLRNQKYCKKHNKVAGKA